LRANRLGIYELLGGKLLIGDQVVKLFFVDFAVA